MKRFYRTIQGVSCAALIALIAAPPAMALTGGEECADAWRDYSEQYNAAAQRVNQGWARVLNTPEAAYDDFNWASSRAERFRNFGACTRSTSLTDAIIDEMERDRRTLVQIADCGLRVAVMEVKSIELDEAISRYNIDQAGSDTVRMLSGVVEQRADAVLAAHECSNHGWSLDLARDRKDWSNRVWDVVR
ncbi:hypothetical protein [Thalassorhabdomicrobium marinisediminis]|uniref:hypothetical protein n=1 Tax=Thalassorhabdomicrobium marinisediminis TaxID=2170577 RepID=UPI00248FAF71|nr:hypothetical protein [Thalassorhabdomicrobium marinisediminis]